jgi:hypothetical protein
MQELLQQHIFINDVLQILLDLEQAVNASAEKLTTLKEEQITEIKTLIQQLLIHLKNNIPRLNEAEAFLSLMTLIYILQCLKKIFSFEVFYLKDKLFAHLSLQVMETPLSIFDLEVLGTLPTKARTYFLYQNCLANRDFLLLLIYSRKMSEVFAPLKLLRLFKHYKNDNEIIAEFSSRKILPEILAQNSLAAALEVFKNPMDYPLDEVTLANIIIQQELPICGFTRRFWYKDIDSRALLLLVFDRFFLQTAKKFQTTEAREIMIKHFLLDESNTFKVDEKVLEDPSFKTALQKCIDRLEMLLVESITTAEIMIAKGLISRAVETEDYKISTLPMRFFPSRDFSPCPRDELLGNDEIELQTLKSSQRMNDNNASEWETDVSSQQAFEEDAIELQIFSSRC